MPSKYRVLSFHHITNNGAFLFAHTLSDYLQAELQPAEVKILDYKSPRLHLAETIKRFKLFQSIPLFYARRSQLWHKLLTSHLELDKDFPHFRGQKKLQRVLAERFDGLIVGMDVWCLTQGTERPTFPNIYWLPEKMEIPKIAYGVSAYNSDAALIHRNREKISSYLNDFTIIGSRDRFTHEMVQQYRTRTDGLVEKVPDLAFLHSIQATGIKRKLAQMGVDFNRPILGILLFGDGQISAEIQKHYHAKGYQILALSMFNPVADFNLGHLLTPFEWAETFGLCSFCITDRFHGSIFCLKNQIPFISLEKDSLLPRWQSKIYDLLADFNLTACYQNTQDPDFQIDHFLKQADEIQASWEKTFKPGILPKILAIQEHHHGFLQRMKLELNV